MTVNISGGRLFRTGRLLLPSSLPVGTDTYGDARMFSVSLVKDRRFLSSESTECLLVRLVEVLDLEILFVDSDDDDDDDDDDVKCIEADSDADEAAKMLLFS